MGFDLTMIAIAGVAVAIAWIIFMLRQNESVKTETVSTSDDEWED